MLIAKTVTMITNNLHEGLSYIGKILAYFGHVPDLKHTLNWSCALFESKTAALSFTCAFAH